MNDKLRKVTLGFVNLRERLIVKSGPKHCMILTQKAL